MICALRILWSYLVTRHFRKFRSRAGLEAWQDRQVRRFLGRVLPRSPFYASLYAGLDGVAWRSFPIIGKKEWVEGFDELNTAGVRAQEAWDVALRAERTRDFAPRVGGLTVGLSTGTTGNRGLFLCSDSEIARYMGSILARVLPGGLLARHRASSSNSLAGRGPEGGIVPRSETKKP
jgi:putative adenylate-forming enzyme